MVAFELEDEDFVAIDLAKRLARRLLAKPSLNPRQIIGLGNALYALDRLPSPTDGAHVEFTVSRRAGTKDFEEMWYCAFRITEDELAIDVGGSVYQAGCGGDSVSEPGWRIELGGYYERDCDLSSLESTIVEHLNLGAVLDIDDESRIAYE